MTKTIIAVSDRVEVAESDFVIKVVVVCFRPKMDVLKTKSCRFS